MKSPLQFSNYLIFLKDYFSSGSSRAGAKSAFAKACGIQTSYLSQILSKRTQLSPEQALRGAEYLEFSSLETEYFLLMVQKARAGTATLENFYQSKMTKLRLEHDKLAHRLQTTTSLSVSAKQKYYSSWIYSVVHVIFSLPHINTLKQASDILNEAPAMIEEATEFLMSEGMIVKTEHGYETRPAQLHLPNDSPLIQQHHSNWRIRSLSAIQKNNPKDLHYSVTFTLSKQDAEKIRENLLQAVQRNMKIVAPSKEEVMYATTIDFFQLA